MSGTGSMLEKPGGGGGGAAWGEGGTGTKPCITALPGRLPYKARTSFQICKPCMWLHDEIFHKHSNFI